MKENDNESNLITNNNNNEDNQTDTTFIRRFEEITKKNKNHNTNLKKRINQMKKANKLHRYKIGIIFFIIYLSINIAELILTILSKYDFDYNPFCETYIRHSAFIIFLLAFPFINKSNSSIFDIMNLTKYYIPDWKKKKMEIYLVYYMYLKELKKNLIKLYIKLVFY